MSFLRLNGVAVPVAPGSAEVSQEDIGDMKRAEDGTPLFNRRTTKRTWTGRTIIRTPAEALAWRDLVAGKGHVLNWELNAHYTSTGLAPTAVAGGFTISSSNPKFGTYRAASTASNVATWPVFASGSPWSIALWQTSDGGSTWNHFVVRSDGAKWAAGVRNDAASTTFVGVSAGVMTLGNGSANGFDDVVCLPFLVPTDWPAQIFGFGYPFGALPRITADGNFVEANVAGGITVKGKAGSLRAFIAAPTSGSRVNNAQDFAFELLEV